MAKIEMRGLDAYITKLSQLAAQAREGVIGPAIHDAASVVADSIQSEISAIPTDNGYGTPSEPQSGLNAKQKAALHNSFGITKMRNDNGFYNVKLGFDGYNDIKTKRWPNGQPNAMVARAVERGTSWLKATPFVKRAVNASKQQAVGIMQTTIDNKIYEILRK